MKFRLRSLIFLFGIQHCLVANGTEDKSFDLTVRNVIAQEQPTKNSGLAIAVIKDGKVVFAKGYGYRDRKHQLPVTTKTLFAIGSSTKAFTSMALKMAENNGLIDLQKPVVDYLSTFKVIDPILTAKINTIDLLAHRTGLPRHDALWYLSGLSREELLPKIQCLSYGKKQTPQFVYNNLLYAVTGVVLEKITSQSWESYVSENIFSPLGMNHTGFFAPDFSQDFAQPYKLNKRIPYKDYTNIGPAGSVISNVEDLAVWVQTHLAKGTAPNGHKIMTPGQMSSMYRVYNKVDDRLNYGLGWFSEKFGGATLIQHSGDADGYYAYVSFMPEKNLGIVAITNQHISPLPLKVAHAVYSELLGVSPKAITSPSKMIRNESILPLDSQKDSPIHTSYVNDEKSLVFENCGYGTMTIKQSSEGRFLEYGNNRWRLWKIPFYGYLFRVEAYGKKVWAPFAFSDKADGFYLPLEPTAEKIYFKKRN
jgi:CubicO group peptidase (beta-lactamase class C family)